MNPNEFEHIVVQLRPKLESLCRRFFRSEQRKLEEVDDVMQETFLRLWQMRERLQAYDSVEALAVMIAKNLCVDCLRKDKREQLRPDEVEVVDHCSTDGVVMERDARYRLRKLMDRLPPSQRRLLLMRSEGMELEEIALVCRSTKNSVKTIISAARKNLLELMDGRKQL